MEIIKRNGKIEEYNEKKVFSAVFEACLNAHLSRNKSYEIAREVTKEANKKVKKMDYISSNNLFIYIVNIMKRFDEDAAFMFATHRDIN
ncbi:MAG: ATP cone domain-containing protein [Nanoarchaeota archaeon]